MVADFKFKNRIISCNFVRMFMCVSHLNHGTHVEVSKQLYVSVLTFHCVRQDWTAEYTRLSGELVRNS